VSQRDGSPTVSILGGQQAPFDQRIDDQLNLVYFV